VSLIRKSSLPVPVEQHAGWAPEGWSRCCGEDVNLLSLPGVVSAGGKWWFYF
jgi:hypothetical protein